MIGNDQTAEGQMLIYSEDSQKSRPSSVKSETTAPQARASEADFWYVSGYLKDKSTDGKNGIRGYLVKLFDKGRKYDDHFGKAAESGDKGFFEFAFERSKFDDELKKAPPELYYEITNKDGKTVYNSLKDHAPKAAHRNTPFTKDAGRNSDLGEIWIDR